jgi:hypothetical protein
MGRAAVFTAGRQIDYRLARNPGLQQAAVTWRSAADEQLPERRPCCRRSGYPVCSPRCEPDGGIGGHREVVQRAVVDGSDDGGAGKAASATSSGGSPRTTSVATWRNTTCGGTRRAK